MIETQSEIDGICELTIIDENSIHIRRPEFDLLVLSKGENTGLKEAAVFVGESFSLSDADHIFETYHLTGIREGSAIFEAELTFDAPGIPEKERTQKKVISVSPYG